jgi:hypothetical protein
MSVLDSQTRKFDTPILVSSPAYNPGITAVSKLKKISPNEYMKNHPSLGILTGEVGADYVTAVAVPIEKFL